MNTTDALAKHDWVWDTLPNDVQEAMNNEWRLLRLLLSLARKNVEEGDDALAESALEFAKKLNLHSPSQSK